MADSRITEILNEMKVKSAELMATKNQAQKNKILQEIETLTQDLKKAREDEYGKSN